MKRLAYGTAVALAMLVLGVIAWKLRYGALLLAGTITLAAAAEPAVQALVRRRLPRTAAVALVFCVGFGVPSAALFVALGALPDELGRAFGQVERAYAHARASWPSHGGMIGELAARLPDTTHLLDGNTVGTLGSGALGFTGQIMGTATTFAIILVLSLFWSAGAQQFERLCLSLLPAPERARVRDGWHALHDAVGVQLRAQLAQSLVVAPLAALSFRAFGVPYPILAALSVAVFRVIPLVGPLLAVAVAFVCGAALDVTCGAASGLATLALLAWLHPVVGERLAGARRESRVLVGVVLIALWDAGGLWALFAAGPLATVIAILAEHLLAPTLPAAPPPRLRDIEQRVADLSSLVAALPHDHPELASMAHRLADLVHDVSTTEH